MNIKSLHKLLLISPVDLFLVRMGLAWGGHLFRLGWANVLVGTVRVGTCPSGHRVSRCSTGVNLVLENIRARLWWWEFGGSLGGLISEVTSQKVRDRTHAFTKIYVFTMEGFDGRPCIGGRP